MDNVFHFETLSQFRRYINRVCNKGTNVFLVFPVESNIYDETFCMYYIKHNCQLFVYIHFH